MLRKIISFLLIASMLLVAAGCATGSSPAAPAADGEGDEALPAFLDEEEEPSDDEDEVLHAVAAE